MFFLTDTNYCMPIDNKMYNPKMFILYFDNIALYKNVCVDTVTTYYYSYNIMPNVLSITNGYAPRSL